MITLNSVSFQLAVASIFKEKKKYFISFVMMILSFSVVMTFYNVFKNDEINQQRVLENVYGRWDVCYENFSKQNKTFLKQTRKVDEIVDVEITGILDDGCVMANYQEDFFDLASIELKGRLPQNNQEILSKTGNIGDRVILSIDHQDYQMTIVGLINDYDQKWVMDAYDYFSHDLDIIKTQTFISGQISNNTLDGVDFNNQVIYKNYPVLDTPSQYAYYHYSNNILTEGYSYIADDSSQTDDLNIVIVFAIIGILASHFYTMNDQKEKLLLYKSLGMTNKQLFIYIFYETVILALLAFLISFPFSYLLSYGVYQMIASYTKELIFDYHFISMLPYVAVIFLTIIIAAFFACYIILIQSLGSVIHKKERTIKKKYHKASRMNVYQICCKEMSYHRGYVTSIAMISAITLTLLSSLVSFPVENLYQLTGDENQNFYYHIETDQPHILDNISFQSKRSEIIEHCCTQYVDNEMTYEPFVVYQEDKDYSQYQLIEGRMIENIDECVYKFEGYKVYSDEENGESQVVGYEPLPPQIGEMIHIYNDTGNIIQSLKVVGILFQEEIETNYLKSQFDAINENYYLVDKQSLPMNNMYYSYEGYSSKDILPFLKSDAKRLSIYINYENQIYTKTSIESFIQDILLIIVGIVFILLIFIVFIDRLFKDLKLLRCLGMTNKQVLKMNMYIYCHSMFLVVVYYNIYISYYLSKISILFIYMFIFFVIFMVLTYVQLRKDESFLPADVKRYY